MHNKNKAVNLVEILKIIKEFVDIFIFIILAIFLFLFSVIIKPFLKKSSKGKGVIIHLSGAISIGDAIKKFGSLDYQLNYEGKIDVFDKIINLWCPVKYNYTLEIKNYIIYERKPFFRYFRWVSVLYNAFIVSLKYYPQLKVIRAWGPFSHGVVAWVISKALKIPYCVSIHADYDLRYKLAGPVHSHVLFGSRKFGKYVEKFVLSHANVILSELKMHTDYVMSYGIKPEKTKLVYKGINLEIFRQPPKYELFAEWFDANRKIISIVGRVTKDNYIEDAIEIAKKVLAFRNDVSFFFAGDGERMEYLKATLREYIDSKKVFAPGYIKSELAKELRKCSTINLCLMAGYSLIEACASGRPAIAYDVEWHSELIQNGLTGYLVKEHDIGKVVEIINILLDDDKLREKIGSASKKIVFDRHDLDETSKMKNKFYAEIIRKNI